MTAVLKVSQWISPEEYLEGERLSDVRHEYIDGCVYAMAGASADHNRIALNIATELTNRLRGGPCEAFMNDMKVKAAAASSLFYYPDVFVSCDPNDDARYFREKPTVIFEVISPETERTDRREKLLAYQAIPSVQSYVIVEQDRVALTVHRRQGGSWVTEMVEGKDGLMRLPEIQVEFPLGRVYERSSVEETWKSA